MRKFTKSKTIRHAAGSFLLTLAITFGPAYLEGRQPTREDFAIVGGALYILYGTVTGRVEADGPMSAPKFLGGAPDCIEL